MLPTLARCCSSTQTTHHGGRSSSHMRAAARRCVLRRAHARLPRRDGRTDVVRHHYSLAARRQRVVWHGYGGCAAYLALVRHQVPGSARFMSVCAWQGVGLRRWWLGVRGRCARRRREGMVLVSAAVRAGGRMFRSGRNAARSSQSGLRGEVTEVELKTHGVGPRDRRRDSLDALLPPLVPSPSPQRCLGPAPCVSSPAGE